MPKRTDISSIQPSHPAGGEGRRVCAGERGSGAATDFLAPSPNPLPPQGERAICSDIGIAAKLDQDCSQDTIKVCHRVRVCEPHNAKPFAFKKGRSGGVVGFGESVAVPIDFYNQPLRRSGEVGDVGIDDILPLELHAQSPGSQRMPECLFGRSHIRSQRFGALARSYVSLHTPSPNPLPLKGERAIGNAL